MASVKGVFTELGVCDGAFAKKPIVPHATLLKTSKLPRPRAKKKGKKATSGDEEDRSKVDENESKTGEERDGADGNPDSDAAASATILKSAGLVPTVEEGNDSANIESGTQPGRSEGEAGALGEGTSPPVRAAVNSSVVPVPGADGTVNPSRPKRPAVDDVLLSMFEEEPFGTAQVFDRLELCRSVLMLVLSLC